MNSSNLRRRLAIVLTALGIVLGTAASGQTAGQVAPSTTRQEIARSELIVAADGSSEFRTLTAAIQHATGNVRQCVIRVKPGIYREKLQIPAEARGLVVLGEDQVSTVITWSDGADSLNTAGAAIGTSESATVTVRADDVVLENLTIQNARGMGTQAVALRTLGDRFIARRCRVLGWQDTLLVEQGRQFFDECFIEGHVDFIFGAATAFFDRCRIHVLGGGCIAAPSTPEDKPYGLIFSQCRISAEAGVKTYLARPWRDFGSAIFARCTLPSAIAPAGWHNWNEPARERTARFGEAENRGPGAKGEARVSWSRQLTAEKVKEITPQKILAGNDNWDPFQVVARHEPGTQISDGPTPRRIRDLSADQQSGWLAYIDHSKELLTKDQAVLSAEVQASGLAEPKSPPTEKISILDEKRSDEWYRSAEALQLAQTVISFQTPSGGWSKAISYADGPRQPGMHWSPQASAELWHYVGTFDNGSTIGQMRFLAKVYSGTGKPELLNAWSRAFEYVLASQYPNGGWPQVFPLEGGYHDAITFNDNGMVHVLELLRDISDGRFDFVAERDQSRARAALTKGIDCIVRSQFPQNGKPTVWCAQHDPITLAPVAARLKEPASLSGGESVEIVKFLRKLPGRTDEVEQCIANAVAWFRRSQVFGMREITRDGRSFWEHDETVIDGIWARFYDLVTNRPIFAGAQDGIIYDDFETMWRNNRFGYDYFSRKGRDVLKGVK